ncbi:MAG: hypothetical protein ACI8ZM_002049 [Crocinitomix sp.]|jgi:hypothetical protein
MHKFILIFSALLLFVSCNSKDNNRSIGEITAQDSDTIIEIVDPASLEITDWDGEYKIYKGNYFSIEYPSNFLAAPNGPVNFFDDYEVIETDEATFTSSNGAVEFFVYSPLWSGEPEFYLEFQDNEELTYEKEAIEMDEFGLEKTIQWMTITDKDGNYSRSYVSTKTESTFLVFGIKSINDATYEKYKEVYLKFKTSLEQFADA